MHYSLYITQSVKLTSECIMNFFQEPYMDPQLSQISTDKDQQSSHDSVPISTMKLETMQHDQRDIRQ